MAVDERLVKKGKPEPRDGLVQEGRAHVELGKKYVAELAENGWSADDTAELEAVVTALESSVAAQADAKIAASSASAAETSGINESKKFLRQLRNALPRAIREANVAGVDASSFLAGEPLGRVTPRISAFLTKIRPAVEKLDEKLKKHFGGKKGTEVLDAVKAKLDGADATQEVAWTTLPKETLSVYETKGRVLELIEYMNRAGKSAFDGQATMIALFNKDILVRARTERAKEKVEEPKEAGGGGSGGGAGSGAGGGTG